MSVKLKVNPWLSIWTKPRDTIRKIVAYDPNYRFPVLAGIYGFPLLLQIAQNFSLGENFPAYAIALIALAASVIVGMIVMSILSGLLLWTGRWIHGEASFREIRASVAWSNVPNIVTIITWIIFLGIFRNDTFFHTFPGINLTSGEYAAVFILFFIQLLVSIWSLIIFLKALGEVQGFSAWKALLNLIIPSVIVLAVIWIIGTVVMWSVH
jgi:hypothetical protein